LVRKWLENFLKKFKTEFIEIIRAKNVTGLEGKNLTDTCSIKKSLEIVPVIITRTGKRR